MLRLCSTLFFPLLIIYSSFVCLSEKGETGSRGAAGGVGASRKASHDVPEKYS